jgi:hypothetical protein
VLILCPLGDIALSCMPSIRAGERGDCLSAQPDERESRGGARYSPPY